MCIRDRACPHRGLGQRIGDRGPGATCPGRRPKACLRTDIPSEELFPGAFFAPGSAPLLTEPPRGRGRPGITISRRHRGVESCALVPTRPARSPSADMGVGHGSKASCWCRLNPSLRRIGAFTSRSETSQPEAPHRPIATAPPWQTCQHPTNLPHHMAQPGNTNRKTTHQCST